MPNGFQYAEVRQYIENLEQQLKKKQDVIDKATEYIESNSNIYLNIMGNKVGFFTENDEGHVPIELLDILKEVE